MWITIAAVVIAYFTIRWVLSWFLPDGAIVGLDRAMVIAGNLVFKLAALAITGVLLWAFVYLPFFAK